MCTIYLERVFCIFVRACQGVSLIILFRCLCWILWKIFSTEEIVPTSRLYWLLLLEDIRTKAKLFLDSNLILLDLSLNFVLSCRLLICQRYSKQYVQFVRQLVILKPIYLQFIYNTFENWCWLLYFDQLIYLHHL